MTIAAVLLSASAIKFLMMRPTVAPPPPLPKETIDLSGAILAGNPQARVAMIEYSEFECPYCGRFAREIKPALWQEFVDSGQVLVGFRHLALEQRHPHALRAAEASECANRQGEFWRMHDALFRDQASLDDASLTRAAHTIGLDGRSFDDCMKTAGAERIRADGAGARALGISGTPSVYLGLRNQDGRLRATQRIDGARPLAEYQAALRQLTAQIR